MRAALFGSMPGLGRIRRPSLVSDLFSCRVLTAMRWIWIDKFLEFRSGKFARSVKNLTLAEEHLHDHFPGYPVMPASLIIEGLAQTGGILVGDAGGFAEKVVLAKIPRAEFFGVACAGDQIIYEVTLTDLRAEGAVVEAKAFLNGELLADAEIVFAHLDNSRANQIFGPKNFVFTQQLLSVLDLAKAQQRARQNEPLAPLATDFNGQPHEPKPTT
jgi:3-hydroxyacyl-[acyl-carrier-protein] dehydratase